MSDFARQQSDFQRGILTGDESVLAEILDSPKEKRDVLFGVYRYAYGSRLVEVMRNDHKLLHSYLGDEMFDAMGHAYVAANPSHHPNLRWFSQDVPDFLVRRSPTAIIQCSPISQHLKRHSTTPSTPKMRRRLRLRIWRPLRRRSGTISNSGLIPVLSGLIFQPMLRRSGWRSRPMRRRRMRWRWSSLPPADMAQGCDADVPRARRRRGDDVG